MHLQTAPAGARDTQLYSLPGSEMRRDLEGSYPESIPAPAANAVGGRDHKTPIVEWEFERPQYHDTEQEIDLRLRS